MRLLAFEYACAGGNGGEPYYKEGRAMLTALLEDCLGAGLEVTTLLHPRFDDGGISAKIVHVRGSLMETARGEMARHDAVWIIAPETGGRLLGLTRLAELPGKRVIGSASDAVEACGDKLLAGRKLRGVVNMPKSRLFGGKVPDFPAVIKPVDGAGCDNTFLVRDFAELEALALPGDAAFLEQPFVPGGHFSAGFLSCGGETELLGVCRQKIAIGRQLCFEGVEGPIEYPHAEMVALMARAVKKAIPSLGGYWGMDFIDDGFGALTLLEVNPRLTSSYPLYRAAAGFNIPRYAIYGVKR